MTVLNVDIDDHEAFALLNLCKALGYEKVKEILSAEGLTPLDINSAWQGIWQLKRAIEIKYQPMPKPISALDDYADECP